MAKTSTKVSATKDSHVKDFDKEFLMGLLHSMLRIRRFEEKAAQMYGLKKIGGFCHLYNGQEAVAVGSVAAIDLQKDYLLTAYRDHGHALAVGMAAKSVMAELYGKITGCSRGKGGSMHMFDVDRHFLGGNGIVGAQIPHATGVAFAQMYRRKVKKETDAGVTLCFFGDGAIHQGAFHESLNMAKVYGLPAIYCCENNRFGMGTAVERVSATHDFAVMAGAYDLPGYTVDGMDVLAVYEMIRKVAKDARESGTAALLDIKTYRYKGHSMSDPAKYRTKDELEDFKRQDPILLLRTNMTDEDMLTDDEYKEMDGRIKEEVNEAVEFAESSEEPPIETMYEDIYV